MSQLKRFYAQAAAAPAAEIDAVDGDDGFAVLLDGKPIRTQGRRVHLIAPTRALADAVAAEWAAQDAKIDPASMPMMTLTATALDRVVPQAQAVAADAAAYAGSDLLCYRAAPDEADGVLRPRQDAAWQPLLDWAAERYGARLVVAEGIMPVAQDNAALMLFGRALGALDAFRLTAVHVMTTATGSLVLALALLEGRLSPEEAHALATLDETVQAEKWGEDEEAAARRARLLQELEEATAFLNRL
ncbi:MAG: ATP12 family protein [Marivibrio sp.]|uniref:ATP12 family chaperone protein n=1 Tax=Marivibrio sp. TaxID=2039719 RepID=UPI0032EFE5B6